MPDNTPEERDHGFAEQDFQEIPEETDEDGEQYHHFFHKTGGRLIATPEASVGENGVQRGLQRLKATFIGTPLFSKDEIHERLTKVKALAVFGSDAISSCAYATEASLGNFNGRRKWRSAYLILYRSRRRGLAFNGGIFLPPDGVCLPPRRRVL